MIDLMTAIQSLRPNAKLVTRGTEIEWLDDTQTQPTDTEIATEVTRLQAEYDTNQYARNRAEAYPSTVDQLDDIYHNGVDGWKATIKAVKDTYPKETI
jgi:hypothetical protein